MATESLPLKGQTALFRQVTKLAETWFGIFFFSNEQDTFRALFFFFFSPQDLSLLCMFLLQKGNLTDLSSPAAITEKSCSLPESWPSFWWAS